MIVRVEGFYSAMRTISRLAVVACLLCSCGNIETADTQGPDTPNVLRGDIIELQELFTARDFALSGGKIYALDSKAKRVTVYGLDGTFIKGFGRGGEGPGEFSDPRSLDVFDKHVAVTEESGRTSLFDTSGAFLHSFRTDGIEHNDFSNMRFLSDSLIFIGGLHGKSSDTYGGMMGHIYTIAGIRKSAFMPMSQMAEVFEVNTLYGASCDFDSTQSLWCGQVLDYIIRRFEFDGTKVDSITVNPAYYRPLSERHPRYGSLDADAHFSWFDSWDKTMELHTINDTLLVYEVTVGLGGWGNIKLDVIDNRDGSIITTHDFIDGSLAYVSKEKQLLLIRRPTNFEPLTRLELVPVSALLNGAD